MLRFDFQVFNNVTLLGFQPVSMTTDKPIGKKWSIFGLPIRRKEKEIAHDCAETPAGATPTRPRSATRDVDVIVDSDFLAGLNASARDNKAGVGFVANECVRVTGVIQVVARVADEHDLAIGVITMIVALAKIRPQGSFRRNLADDIDAMDCFARIKGAAGKEPTAFNSRLLYFNGILPRHYFFLLSAAT
jgi:hypothetical protein